MKRRGLKSRNKSLTKGSRKATKDPSCLLDLRMHNSVTDDSGYEDFEVLNGGGDASSNQPIKDSLGRPIKIENRDEYASDVKLLLQGSPSNFYNWWPVDRRREFKNLVNNKLLDSRPGPTNTAGTAGGMGPHHNIDGADAFGSSFYFGGGDTDHIDITDANTVKPLGSEAFTIECWFYVESFRSTGPDCTSCANNPEYWSGLISSKGSPVGGGNYDGWVIAYNDYGKLLFDSGDATSNPGLSNGVGIQSAEGLVTTGKWNHVAVTRESTGLTTLWLNRVIVASDTDNKSYANPNQVRIGDFYADTTGYTHKGYINDVRITRGISRYHDIRCAKPPCYPYTIQDFSQLEKPIDIGTT